MFSRAELERMLLREGPTTGRVGETWTPVVSTFPGPIPPRIPGQLSMLPEPRDLRREPSE